VRPVSVTGRTRSNARNRQTAGDCFRPREPNEGSYSLLYLAGVSLCILGYIIAVLLPGAKGLRSVVMCIGQDETDCPRRKLCHRNKDKTGDVKTAPRIG